VSPYTTGASLAFHSSEAGAGSDIVSGKPARRPPTPQEVDALLREGKISDSQAREMLRRLPVAPATPSKGAINAGGLDGEMADSTGAYNASMDAKTENASKPKSFSDENFLTNEIKLIIDARKKQVPVTREDRLKQFKADQEAFGLKDDVGKEQVDRLAALAGQAKQDRDVGLWLSAATGFFAMGAGKSQYALQNFAAGAGIGIEQARSALSAYSKRQTELNTSQFEIEKARRAEKRGDLESYRTFTRRAEEKEQAADDRYSDRMIKLFEIKLRGTVIQQNQQLLAIQRDTAEREKHSYRQSQLRVAVEKAMVKWRAENYLLSMNDPKAYAAAESAREKKLKSEFEMRPYKGYVPSPEEVAITKKYGL
jgi:hypothetical protein